MYQPYTLPASTAACSGNDAGGFNQMMDPSMLGLSDLTFASVECF
ncbi:unnamed protein product [Nippostrongylus brasiliensis]|uniref:Orthodenticle homeobox 1 n=1 Tax=Nippostrongylus brasiliensis TaxID=27835 RepID=A0A0N4XNA3_NIPBR|nr:unnamed protein product [Nippostrongylus brasiliensis]